MMDAEKLQAIAALIRAGNALSPPSQALVEALDLTTDRWFVSRYAGNPAVLGGAVADYLNDLAQRVGELSHADMPASEFGAALGAGEGFASKAAATDQDDFVAADIEARLTEEVHRLAIVLLEGADRFQSIGQVAPRCDLGQLVAQSFQLFALQFAQAFLQLGGKQGFLGEHAEQLGDMGLSIEQAFREICLDGRKFLAIAYVDPSLGERNRGRDVGGNGG